MALRICSNGVVLPQVTLDRAVLQAVLDALNPAVLRRAVEVALSKLAHAREKHTTRRAEVEREVGQVEQRVNRLIDALADGSLPADDIRARLTAETQRKKALARQLEHLDTLVQMSTLREADLASRVEDVAQDVVAALSQHTAKARQMLRKLLGKEKIELEPVGAGRQRGYNFRGALRIDRLIGGDTFGTHLTVVAPTGIGRQKCSV